MSAAEIVTDVPAGDAQHRRSIRPARLVNGRALFGGLLIAVAVLGVLIALRPERADSIRYVVAREPIAAGTTISSDQLGYVEAEVPEQAARQLVTDPALIVGQVAERTLAVGQLLTAFDAPADDPNGAEPLHEVTVDLTDAQVPLDLQTGEVVTVLATFGTGENSVTRRLTDAATIVDVDRDGGSLGSRSRFRVTIGTPGGPDAAEITHAALGSTLTLLRVPPDSAVPEQVTTAELTGASAP